MGHDNGTDRLAELRAVNQVFRGQLNDLLSQINALKTEVVTNQEKLVVGQTAFEDASREAAEREQSLRSALDAEAVKVNELQATLDAEINRTVELQSALDAASGRAVELQSALDTKSSNAGAIQSALDAEIAKVAELQSALDVACQTVEAREQSLHLSLERQTALQGELAESLAATKTYLADIHRLELASVRSEARVVYTEAEIERLNERIVQMEDSAWSRYQALEQRYAEEKRTIIERFSSDMLTLSAALGEKDQWAAAQIADLQSKKSHSEEILLSEISALKAGLESASHAYSVREGQLNEQIASLTSEFEHANNRLLAEHQIEQSLTSERIDGLQSEVAALRASTSWRMTEPFRRIVLVLKGQRATPPASEQNQPDLTPPLPEVWGAASAAGEAEVIDNAHELSEESRVMPIGQTREAIISPLNAAPNLMTLLQYDGRQFIDCAYITLLRRLPDPDGGTYYLNRLMSGLSKIQVLAQIMYSAEAKIAGVNLPGLRRAVFLNKIRRLPVVGPLMGAVLRPLHQASKDNTHQYQTWIKLDNESRQNELMLRKLDSIQSALASFGKAGVFPADLQLPEPLQVQEAAPSPVHANVTPDNRLQLDSRRSVGEPEWLSYLASVIDNRLMAPLMAAGTKPPKHSLVVLVDCSDGVGTSEEREMTARSISHLKAASEYAVHELWYAPSGNDEPALNGMDVATQKTLVTRVDENDRIIVIRPGDELRAEIHMALKYFGAFKAEFTLIDGFLRQDDRIYPVLYHAVDSVHATYCDYFFGRFVVAAKSLCQHLDDGAPGPSAAGAIICAKPEDRRKKRVHIAIPLMRLNLTLEDIAAKRESLVNNGFDADLAVKPTRLASSLQAAPTVSAIICTKDAGFLLQQLLHRLRQEPLIKDIIIVSNNTTNLYALKTLEAASKWDNVKILSYSQSFNFSKQCNLGAKHASGDHFLFLNDDIAPITENWLPQLMQWMDKPRLVGPVLLYPNQSVQHAGMHLGFNGCAGHTLRHSRLPEGDYGFFLSAPRQVSCLTGAVLLTQRQTFEALNGFDPRLATFLQDVDLSLRALNSDVELVLDARTILFHMESVSVKPTLTNQTTNRAREKEYDYFIKRWRTELDLDVWINPLFDPMDESMSVLRV